MLPAIVLFWQSHLKTGQAQCASPRHKMLETALSTAGHCFSRQDLVYFRLQHKRLMLDILIHIVWEKMELIFQITPNNRLRLSIFREAFQSMKWHRQILYNKKLRTKLPNSCRIASQGRKALILHETPWKMNQSHIITSAQGFSSLWQEEMHFAYMIAVGSSRLQRLEKLWLSLLRYRILEESGDITARPFWKGSQQVQTAVIVPENKLEGAVSGSHGDGEDVPLQRLEASWRRATNWSVLLGDIVRSKDTPGLWEVRGWVQLYSPCSLRNTKPKHSG